MTMRLPRFLFAPAPAPGRLSLWVGLLLAVLGAVWASHARLAQRATWDGQASQYRADGVPMMTTLDAYYALRMARLSTRGHYEPGAVDATRHFSRPPTGSAQWVPQWLPRDLPLLARLIATASHWSGLGLDEAAWTLPPLLSSLFMLPLFVAFWRLGAPAAGLTAGLVGSFCTEYFQRTGIGWSDTDQLNLLFPWLLTASFLLLPGAAGRDRSPWRLIAGAALAGFVNQAYSLWYWKPGLALGLALVLGLHLALAGLGWRRWAPAVAAFVLCSGPRQFGFALASLADFGAHYLWAARTADAEPLVALRLPDVWSTISEIQPLALGPTLAAIVPQAELAAIGLVAFVVWAVPRWRQLAPLLPWLALGALALGGSRRFILYLAPFVGAGWGVLAGWVVGVWLDRPPADAAAATPARVPVWSPLVAMAAAALTFAVWLKPAEARLRAPAPAIAAPVFHELKGLAARLPADTRLWTWWDLGFALADTTGLGVYHDGAVQFTPQTHLIALSLASDDPALLHDLIRAVDRAGNVGIRAEAVGSRDFGDLVARLRQAAPATTDKPVAVLFTPDMVAKFASMQALGRPLPTAGGHAPRPFGIHALRCDGLDAAELRCDGVTVDLLAARVRRTGLADGVTVPPQPLKRLVVTEHGRVAREQLFDTSHGLTVELATTGTTVHAVYLLDEPAFRSNLNQMYLLGRHDSRRFAEVQPGGAAVRAYRVLSASGD